MNERRYLFEYSFAGADWGITVPGRSQEDALARIQAMASARYKGEIAATIPVPSFLYRMWCSLRGGQ